MKATILFALFALFAMFALAPAAASEVAVVEADEVADEVAVADEVDAEDEEEETADEESEEEADEESEAEAEEEETSEESEDAFIEAGADSSCLKGFSGAKLASTAASYQAAYKKAGIKYSQPKRSFGARPKSGFSDCSSFVNSVLQATGYACIFKGGENTANMNKIIRTKGGYKPFPAAAGDIVMWSGHTGIVTKVCSKTTAAMVAMGNSGPGATGCVTIPAMKKWGGGTFLGFWTPRP